ncbi:FecR domain-containing protein [Pseudoduganella sp. LjRoot289]|uniref:FecR family protein n=1 Tax=Pseudoduganella sp. LjRoot289 TaxID=3342314 RepID=UPI003ECD7674
MSKHLKIEQQAAAWLARKDGDQWSAAEQAQLDQWLGLATAHRVAYLRLAAAWSKADQLAPGAPVPASPPARPDHVLAEAGRPTPPRFSQWRIAAAILVTVGATAGLLAVRENSSEVRYETQLGAHQTHALNDGSKLTLNTATQVRARISRGERTVWLDKGEAYFDVAHDTAHPFVVMSGTNRITVLGTKFTVRREAGGTNVVVVDGRVQVENGQSSSQPPLVLVKHQKVVATPANILKSDESDARIEQILSWREGKLVFDQVTLEYAAGEFNRYNKKRLVLADAEAAKLQISGRFDVGNAQGFANLLQRGFGLEVRETNDAITVASRRQGRAP